MAKILLTGAAGFIGSHVFKRMAEIHEVIAIDNLTAFSNQDIKLKRIANLTGHKPADGNFNKIETGNFVFSKLDILDEAALDKLFSDSHFDLVIHLAAMTGIRQSVEHPDIYEKVNVRGFYNILEGCKKHGVKRLLFASSSSVYGACQDVPFTEQSNTDTPLNLYAATKKMNELMAYSYATLHHIHCIGLRFFTVYGPWTRPDMATYTFIESILNGRTIKLFNSGNMERDFTYVDDVVDSIDKITLKMIQEPVDSIPAFRIFNIGEGKPINLKNYLAIIESLLGKSAIIENHPLQKGEMMRTYADCSSLFDYTGFKPRIWVNEGLAETINWFNSGQRT